MDNHVDLGSDIASAMLRALTSGYVHTEVAQETVQLDEQKRYLMRYIGIIDLVDRKSIGNVLVMNNKRALLQPCAEGTVINLDMTPPYIINQMYDLMIHKMNKRK